jgi:hypothetical protein
MGITLLLVVRYKIVSSADHALSRRVSWKDIKCVPGMVITSAMDHVSDFIWHWSSSWLRLLGLHYAHYAVVVEKEGRLYALEWNGYAKDIPHDHETVPIRYGTVYLQPLRDYLRQLYYYHPSTVNVFYPKHRTNLPFRLDWIQEIDREGYFHCIVLAYRYLAKAGMVPDYASVVPRLAKYNPISIRQGLISAGFRERYFRWEK